MKSLRLTQLQRSVEAAPLPAALAGTLMAALLLQAALPIEADLPPVQAAASAPVRRTTVRRVAIVADPAIARRDIFAPSRGGGAAVAGDVRLLGLARSGSGAAAVLGGSDGTVTLRPGQSFGGYRLAGVGRDAVVLEGKDGRRILRIGQGLAPTAPAAPAAEVAEP